ncbi:MAG: DUF2110 family protein [Asgard group archaeon]|nr:DUF2110 family protein [Asgard group archaeon]
MQFTILEKTYNVAKHSSAKALDYILSEELENLDVEIVKIEFNKEKYAEITLDGNDEVMAKNFLINNHGSKRSISTINVGDQILGRFKDVGGVKFGSFVDAGLETSKQNIDALYPLFAMREQLADGNKVPLMNILRAFGIVENLPMFFEITKREILGGKIWVELTEQSLDWIFDSLEREKEALILCGTTRRMIKQALIRTEHVEDIEIIERIGLLEYRLVCKKGTRADGLIPELGPHLGRTKIGAQVPKRVLELFDA